MLAADVAAKLVPLFAIGAESKIIFGAFLGADLEKEFLRRGSVRGSERFLFAPLAVPDEKLSIRERYAGGVPAVTYHREAGSFARIERVQIQFGRGDEIAAGDGTAEN